MRRATGIGTMLLLVASAAAAAGASSCARSHDIFQPVPGALDTTIADTSGLVIDAAVRVLTDRGLSVVRADRSSGVVESEFVDVTALDSGLDPAQVMGNERNVKFRFRAIRSFGATRLFGEAVYQLGNVPGRSTERMVSSGNPAMATLRDMLDEIGDRVAEEQARRNPAPPPAR